MNQQPRHLAEQNLTTRVLESFAVKFPGLYQPIPGRHHLSSRRTA